jgi:hypothetical protein
MILRSLSLKLRTWSSKLYSQCNLNLPTLIKLALLPMQAIALVSNF